VLFRVSRNNYTDDVGFQVRLGGEIIPKSLIGGVCDGNWMTAEILVRMKRRDRRVRIRRMGH
jgi:hypothetical protein